MKKIEVGGGLRLEQHKDVLSFTVNEALYLETGQGIEEMLAISLEPDIAIETFHDYVQIRGIIILQGECKKTTENLEEVGTPDNVVTNYIEKIIDTEPGQAMFSHRFPVEVSVPKNRIQDISNVKVEVASFDYELPSTQLLNINATLHIHGIVADEVVIEEPDLTAETLNNNEQNTDNTSLTTDTLVDADIVETAEIVEDETAPVEESIEIKSDEPTTSELEPQRNEEQPTAKEEIDIQLNESETTDGEEQVKDVLFLTDLFGGIAEESSTTLRIHIIQEEDTVESIAKRYNVSALQLMKDNQLSADEMIPGNLIHIQDQN